MGVASDRYHGHWWSTSNDLPEGQGEWARWVKRKGRGAGVQNFVGVTRSRAFKTPPPPPCGKLWLPLNHVYYHLHARCQYWPPLKLDKYQLHIPQCRRGKKTIPKVLNKNTKVRSICSLLVPLGNPGFTQWNSNISRAFVSY